MTPLPFADVGHAIAFWTVYAIWFALEIRRDATLRSGEGSRRDDRGSYRAIVVGVPATMIAVFFVALSEPSFTITGDRNATFLVGIALMIVGVVLRAYAIRTLGDAFTFDVATRDDQLVCEAGPYRYVRHPAYAGSVMTIVGIALALGNVAGLAIATTVTLALYGYRIAVEEDVLCRDLGAPYVAYRKRTRRLIPFVF